MRTIVATGSRRACVISSIVLIAVACSDVRPANHVTTEPPPPTEPTPPTGPAAYALTLSAAALSSDQGSWTSPAMLNVVRTNFAGDVTFNVENLPPGVSAFIYPYGPNASNSGSSWQLWLGVAGDAPPGTFANLLVRGVTPGLTDRTAQLTLTISERSFTLTLSSSAVSIPQGAAAPVATVNVLRNNFTGPVTLYADIGNYHGNMPDGVSGDFAPSETTGNSSMLTLRAAAGTPAGVYDLVVWGSIGPYGGATTKYFEGVPLKLTVTAAPKTGSH